MRRPDKRKLFGSAGYSWQRKGQDSAEGLSQHLRAASGRVSVLPQPSSEPHLLYLRAGVLDVEGVEAFSAWLSKTDRTYDFVMNIWPLRCFSRSRITCPVSLLGGTRRSLCIWGHSYAQAAMLSLCQES